MSTFFGKELINQRDSENSAKNRNALTQIMQLTTLTVKSRQKSS